MDSKAEVEVKPYSWSFPPENAIAVESKGLQKLLTQIGRTLEEHQQAIDTPPWLDKIERKLKRLDALERNMEGFQLNALNAKVTQGAEPDTKPKAGVPLGDPLNSTPPAEDSSVTVGTEAESKSTAPDGDNKRIQISKDPDLIQLLMQQEERIVGQQDHKTSNVYMVLELLKRQVSRLPSDRDFHRLKNEWNSFSSKSTDSAESAAKEMSDKVDRKVEADLKEMISWKGRVQAEIESRQTKMETSFQGLLGSFGDLHEESMSGLTELSVFAKSKFESLEEENTRLTAAVERISDMSNENAKTMEGMQEKMENVETVVKDMNDDVRSSREKLETLTLDMKLNFEETEVKIEDLHALMEELKVDLAATTEELTGAQVTLLNLGNDVVSNTDHIAEVFKLGVRDMPERFREIEEVKLVEIKEVVQTNKAVHDEEITTLQRTLKQKAIHIEKLSSQVDTAKRELMAKGEEIKQTQEDVSKGFEDVNEKIAKMKAAQETIDTAIKEEAKTTRGRVKVVETVVPLVAEMETQLTTISEDAFKAKTETEEALGNIQSDVNSTKQAISDSKRHQEKLLSASEKKMRAPVIELKARVDNVEVSTKNSAEQSSMLKRKVEQVAMHVDDSPDALAKDRLLKVVKLCLDFQDTAANNSGQKALTFGDKVQAKMANHAQHLAEYIANRADFACLRQLISGATIEDIMYIHDQVDILRHEMTEDFLKHMVQLVKEKAKVGDDPPKIILEARKIFTHRFRRAIEMSLTKYEQVQVIGNTRIGRVSVPTCVACDRPLVSKGRAKREDANPADGAPSRANGMGGDSSLRSGSGSRSGYQIEESRPIATPGGTNKYIYKGGFRMPKPGTGKDKPGSQGLTNSASLGSLAHNFPDFDGGVIQGTIGTGSLTEASDGGLAPVQILPKLPFGKNLMWDAGPQSPEI